MSDEGQVQTKTNTDGFHAGCYTSQIGELFVPCHQQGVPVVGAFAAEVAKKHYEIV